MKIWILLVCALAAGVSVNAWSNEWDNSWNDDYDDEWFKTQLEKLGIYSDEQKDADDDTAITNNSEKAQDEMDKIVEEDIKKFQENGDDDKIDDYQFEDNRSEQNEKDFFAPADDVDEANNQDVSLKANNQDVSLEANNQDVSLEANNQDDRLEGNSQDVSLEANEDDYDDYGLKIDDDFESNSPEDETAEAELKFSKDDDIVPLSPPQLSDEFKQIVEDTEAIINGEEPRVNSLADDTLPQNDEIDKIMEETKSILDEESEKPNDFGNDDDIKEEDILSKIMEETKAILEENEKPNDFAPVEMNQDDEEKLHLLRENSDDADEINRDVSDTVNESVEQENDENVSNNIVDSDEDTVDKVYKDLNEDLDELFETLSKLTRSEDEDDEKMKPADVDYAVNSDESLDDKSDYENLSDSNLSDIFSQHSRAIDDVNLSENETESVDDTEKIFDVNKISSQETKQSEEQVLEYINDALLSEDNNEEKPAKSVNVDDLTNEQLAQLRNDFEIQHSDVFDVEALSDNHIVNEITLEYGETKVIESENYPSGYPTNRIVDWIVTGKGQGIELNVTDFAVNSALGDYLMVKPGQLDDSGVDGIIFSYHLNEPRAYRFTDVDRIFIRFDSKLGMSFLRGFHLTLKMIAPLPAEPEPAPEPEPVLPEPHHSLTVMLGGLTLSEFQDLEENFRLLVADMATMYINANGIAHGLNTTAEITQIISVAVCNVHWPGYEECAQVRFSVPLVYEDEDEDAEADRLHEADLRTMWDTYVDTDPFAARLRQMGIEEFSVPNDSGILTVWLVVALGVMVSAAMLAIALWRYSCFEDYTRMPAYSDTDSLHEKRSSLYPTPHQMLPPLYADNDYNSTKVDMGGYENRSYTRADMYDLDSDEDVIVARDSNASNASVQPRDFSV